MREGGRWPGQRRNNSNKRRRRGKHGGKPSSGVYYTRLRAHERRCVYGKGGLPCAQGRPNRPSRIGYLGRRRRTSGFCKGRDRGKTLTSAKKKKSKKKSAAKPSLQSRNK